MITKCRIFEGMSKEEIESLIPYLKPDFREYKKGEYIYMAGDYIKDIFFLLEGCIQLIREDSSGARSLIAQYTMPGTSFCETFASVKAQSSINYYVKTNSRIMTLPYKNIMSLPLSAIQLHLKLSKNLISILANKANNTFTQLEHVSKNNIRKKIFSYLSTQRIKSGKNEFVIPINKTELADFLFINRSAMTRELAAMKKDKLINFKGKKFKIL
ncbi:MAG: Crp/Fnr family transcriptional regulator [Endomicrobia bacterium]|nr:Crp/Fnr family transcriptional regulator [Endomicrobiia bacterium]MCL2506559.1 Crp/Fnr family transcriptional regulator [Endomicrobiia bacterium]MCL2506604.1 Crp/Fnr family transcriptional regulator [Endomicrobiia bacterium]